MSDSESDSDETTLSHADMNGQMRFIRNRTNSFFDGKNSGIEETRNYVVYNNSKSYIDDNTIRNEFIKFVSKIAGSLYIYDVDDLNIIVNDYPSFTIYIQAFDDVDNIIYYKVKNLNMLVGDFMDDARSIQATDVIELGTVDSEISADFVRYKKICEEFLHNIHESLSPCQILLRNAELRLPLPIPISISDLPKDPNRLTFLKYDIDYYRLDGNNAQSYNKDSLEEVLKGYDCKNPTTRSIITQIDKIRFISPILPNRSLLPFSSFDSRKRKRSLG